MKKIAAVVLLFGFVFSPAFGQKYASISATKANIRACAGTKCAVKWYAWKYTPVLMLGTNASKDWVQVKDFEGFTGWVSASLLSAQGGMSAKTDLNVRQSASVNSPIICTVEKGYPFKYISKKGSWVEVEDDPETPKQGKCHGWVYGQTLWGFFKQ